ncbi:UPF0246 protein [Kordiimonas sediminis]|uniref:UPF0246 protein GCM10017044_15860 n=1 Tax=Kordiimonas sediminis TaxID=1735581 RepID=A0A919ATS1_9PROT|nr:peroxide stress protein YaaA [Kordiimonas sediminis]GHF22433.1 UPF0246 protein [Kordiimonas sediminis]
MLIVLSPAKKLDFESENLRAGGTEPVLMEDAKELVKKAQTLKPENLKAMMGISDALAELNMQRFHAFKTPFTDANARPALDAFQGDVYVGLDADSMSEDDRSFANEHIRILSGLYGVLRPLDLMQAYRLEMGTKFATDRGKNLYDFWGARISSVLNEAVGPDRVLVNLASGEYFKAVDKKSLNARIITPNFKEISNGQAKIVSFFAKKARGMMARYAVDNRITDVDKLKDFDVAGYRFDPDQSTDDSWIFTRPKP